MGVLCVNFIVGLAHPLSIPQGVPDLPIRVKFDDTGNTVCILPPKLSSPSDFGESLGAFDSLALYVTRQCTDEEGKDTTYANNERLHINRDAGRAFWRLFETLRELESQKDYAPSYPVAPAEAIQQNPLVRTCETEWIYNGVIVGSQPFGGVGSIGIEYESWVEAKRQLEGGVEVPAYRSFAADALYFATAGDPLRAIVMACAAWETALREYLETIASTRDGAYVVASNLQGIPLLYDFVKIARGGPAFCDWPGMDDERRRVEELPKLRNKLLHRGERNLPEGAALNSAIGVLDAIEWLFAAAKQH